MPRGGKREGSGRKSKWQNKGARTIRVPTVLVDRLMEVAHHLDRGGDIEFIMDSMSEAEVFESGFQLRPHPNLSPMSGRALAKRCHKAPSTVNESRTRVDFITWSAALDPEGVAWKYDEGSRKFHPYELIDTSEMS